jgi:hypothetical protein
VARGPVDARRQGTNSMTQAATVVTTDIPPTDARAMMPRRRSTARRAERRPSRRGARKVERWTGGVWR